jgi:peroxiredoxin
VTEPSGQTPDGGGTSAGEPRARRHRLDPDRAAAARRGARHPPPPTIDTRPYQRAVGLFGLLLVVMVSVSFLLSRGQGTAGIPAGRHLPLFAAPLAASTLNGSANLHPHCTLAHHDPRALNICLMVKQAPLVLALFVTSSGGCEQEVNTLQALSYRYPAREVSFAAVAVSTSQQDARQAVRAHRWTIPVGYDPDGRVGAAYGVAVCPIVELARRGGTVERRLIGEHWSSISALMPQIRALLAG